MSGSRPSRRNLHATAIAVLTALTAAAYASSFGASFQLDDYPVIVEDVALRLPQVFSSPLAMYRTHGVAGLSRFFGYLSFGVDRQLWGLDVRGFHATSLLVHLGASLFVYALALLLFRTPRLSRSELAAHAPAVALVAAALFAVHPVQTQAVTYLVQRFTSLATLFGLAGTCAWLRYRLGSGRGRWGWLALSIAATVAAMTTKEIAFTFPLMALAAEVLFFEGRLSPRLLRLVPLLATMAIIPALVLAGGPVASRITAGGEQALKMIRLERGDYLLTQARVVLTYLRLLVLPVDQNLVYDYPVEHSLSAPVVLSGLAHLAALGGAILLARRSRRGEPALALLAFGIVWFYVALSVESLAVVIVDVIFEHRVYYPSVGFCLAIASGAVLAVRRAAARWPAAPKLASAVALVAVLALAAATFARNGVWATEATLWTDVAEKSPGMPAAQYMVGVGHMRQGRYADAIAAFRRAAEVNPYFVTTYPELARAYALSSQPSRMLAAQALERYLSADFAGALALWDRAVAAGPTNPDAHHGRGLALVAIGRAADGAEEMRLACAMGRAAACANVEKGSKRLPLP